MSTFLNTQVKLRTRPDEVPSATNFEVVSGEMPKAGAGQILCRTIFLSLDPYMRGQISGRHISGSINPGDLMRGETVSEVIESDSSEYKVGDYVKHFGGWQSYSVADPDDVSMVNARLKPLSLALGVMGMPGLTAYAGVFYLGDLKETDFVLVSAASGAVGSMVGQMALNLGCRVIGIAGSDEKCEWLRDVAGFHGTINYKTENLSDAIKRECPDGVDYYFDNVGGDMLDTVMSQLAIGARVVLCGLMAQYNTDVIPPGPNPATIIKARATVRGLVVYDFFDKTQEFLDYAIPLLDDNKIKYIEDVTVGLEQAPDAFARLMNGQNFGKTIIKAD